VIWKEPSRDTMDMVDTDRVTHLITAVTMAAITEVMVMAVMVVIVVIVAIVVMDTQNITAQDTAVPVTTATLTPHTDDHTGKLPATVKAIT
jgi:hypothetical protein